MSGTSRWKQRCGAALSKGKQGNCSLPAGHGTDHPGVGQCKLHGGSSGVGIRIAAQASLEQLIGYQIEIGPLEALLLCVRIAAAEVAFFTSQIAGLDPNHVLGRPQRQAIASTKDDWEIVELKIAPELNIWIKARQGAVENLARYSTMALKAGVEERLVSIAEQMGDRLASAIEGILTELKLTPAQMKKAPQVIRAQLYALEGGMNVG